MKYCESLYRGTFEAEPIVRLGRGRSSGN